MIYKAPKSQKESRRTHITSTVMTTHCCTYFCGQDSHTMYTDQPKNYKKHRPISSLLTYTVDCHCQSKVNFLLPTILQMTTLFHRNIHTHNECKNSKIDTNIFCTKATNGFREKNLLLYKLIQNQASWTELCLVGTFCYFVIIY